MLNPGLALTAQDQAGPGFFEQSHYQTLQITPGKDIPLWDKRRPQINGGVLWYVAWPLPFLWENEEVVLQMALYSFLNGKNFNSTLM